jgi:hypothetical protein
VQRRTFWQSCFAALFLIAIISSQAVRGTAQQGNASFAAIAPAPPLGWNSWDAYGMRISEQQFRENAEALHAKLQPFGYRYAVIDEGWYMHNPEDRPHPEKLKYAIDAFGRFIPVPERFPSALQQGGNAGFEQLAAWVHAQGLKFGIHIIRGIPRETVEHNLPIAGSSYKAQDAADQGDPCPWDPTSWGIRDNEAGQAWYNSLMRQYAVWGVDFIKVDCIADHPYKGSEIRQIQRAIQNSGRAMLLSLSPGPMQTEHLGEVKDLAQMWRMSNDIWDVWQGWGFPIGVKNQFENTARWAAYAKPGNWPDADMLPIGELRPFPDVGPGPRHTRLTEAEQRTLVTLWSMARSPLILGANLTLLDDQTLKLITNQEMLRVDQSALASREVRRQGDMVIWTADLPHKQHAIAVFNLGDQSLPVDIPIAELGLKPGEYRFKDVWMGAGSQKNTHVRAKINPHDCIFMLAEAARHQ